jgi:hypothetical protein
MSALLLALTLLFQGTVPSLQKSGIVTGVLRSGSGMPVEGIRVALRPVGEDDLIEGIGETDKDGRYRLESISPGRYYIVVGRGFNQVYHPGVPELQRATTILVTAGATTEAAAMPFVRVKVSGRVVDMVTGAGRRVQSVWICCEFSPAFTRPNPGNPLHTPALVPAVVAEDGSFSLPSLAPGNYYIQIADSQVIPLAQVVSVGDIDVQGIQVKVSTGFDVEGGVADRLGQAVSAVNARLLPRERNTAFDLTGVLLASGVAETTPLAPQVRVASRPTLGEISSRLAQAATGQWIPVVNGRFSIGRVLPGTYVLEIVAPGGNSVEREIEVAPNGVTTVQIEMPFTQVVARVVVADGSPLPKLPGSIRFVGNGKDRQVHYAYPDTQGRALVHLEQGEYRVFTESLGPTVRSVSDGAKDLRTELFVVDGRRSSELLITLE